MAARQYTQKEWRLLSWWLATYHPHAEIAMNVRLGPTRRFLQTEPFSAVEAAAARVRNRWADAVFIEHGAVHVVEAKLEPDPGIFSQLVHYGRKLRADPAYAEYRDAPLKLVALVYHDDPSVAQEAPWYGVQWVVFRPDLAQLPPAAERGLGIVGGNSPLPANWPARLNAWGIKALGGV